MPRLRITVVLSLLTLLVGIVGTGWLSDLSANEPLALPAQVQVTRPEPSRHHAVRAAHARVLAATARAVRLHSARSGALSTGRSQRAHTVIADQKAGSPFENPVAALPPELVPLEMPVQRDVAYDQLRGHLDGRVVMRVSVNGRGHVTAATVASSSGDALLDAHALRNVRGWRFAVPPDYPDGLSADLPMRFSSHNEPVASVP